MNLVTNDQSWTRIDTDWQINIFHLLRNLSSDHYIRVIPISYSWLWTVSNNTDRIVIVKPFRTAINFALMEGQTCEHTDELAIFYIVG